MQFGYPDQIEKIPSANDVPDRGAPTAWDRAAVLRCDEPPRAGVRSASQSEPLLAHPGSPVDPIVEQTLRLPLRTTSDSAASTRSERGRAAAYLNASHCQGLGW
jgi:hypothetical protein